jgi:hypothetical protein
MLIFLSEQTYTRGIYMTFDLFEYKNCLICDNALLMQNPSSTNPNFIAFMCPRCGTYIIDNSSIVYLQNKPNLSKKSRFILSNNIFHNYNFIHIKYDKLKSLIEIKDRDFLTKFDNLLLSLNKNKTSIGKTKIDQTNINTIQVEGWICGKNELIFMLKQYKNYNFIKLYFNKNIIYYSITFDGYKYLNQLITNISQSKQAFIAMSFQKCLDKYYFKAIIPTIEDINFNCIRIDLKEHINKIDDEIIVEIKKSRFIIADLTYHKPNVYYEFGYAHALGIPVFFTCRSDHKNKMHFDIQQYNCIFWNNKELDFLQKSLINRIRAVLNIN